MGSRPCGADDLCNCQLMQRTYCIYLRVYLRRNPENTQPTSIAPMITKGAFAEGPDKVE